MSEPARRERWLQELALPLLLLAVYTACFSLYSLHHEVSEAVERARADTRRTVAEEMTQLQSSLDYLLRAGNMVAVRESLASQGHNVHLQVGLLVDEQQQVVASTRLALVGRAGERGLAGAGAAGEPPPEAGGPGAPAGRRRGERR